jgi:MraZ protein
MVAMTTGFVGEYLHTVDNKGRVALPAKFREMLGPRFMIARGLDQCLTVYPSEEWVHVLETVKGLPQNQKEARAYARYFLSGAMEVDPDKQGRIGLPQSLREYAGISKDVYVLGVGNRVEVWDKAAWDSSKLDIGERFSSIAESVPGI